MAEPRKRCLYEILGVNRDSTQDEIRSAYRKLALRLHPDKLAQTAGISPADATAAFQELLHAYEVLSDPKERSWYDSHRSQILFTDPSKSHKPSSFFDVDLFSFFSSSVFSGFSDTGKGFFKVYGDLFAKIYAQELWFAKELGLGLDAVTPAPLIGNLDSLYSQVTAFYNYWLGFCTVMDFGWVDEYDTSMGPNRRSRRAMEEENRKARKKAKREYNDSVRGLAAFVKKRDKRVVDMQVKRKLEEEKKRAEEMKKKKEEERKRMEKVMMYEEPEWARIEEEIELRDDENEKKEKDREEFYCVVCNKKFKSDKQWKNHEQSKKHRDKVVELRNSFEEEEEVPEDDGDGTQVAFEYEPPEEENSDAVDELCEGFKDDIGLQDEGVESGTFEGSDKKLDSDEEEISIVETMVSEQKNRKNEILDHDVPKTDNAYPPDNEEQSFMGHDTQKKSRRRRAAKKGTGAEADVEAVSEGTSETPQDDSEVQNQENDAEDTKEGASCSVEEVVTRSKGDRVMGKNQKHDKKPVDGKGAGKKDTNADTRNSSKGKKQKATSKAPSNACETCGESFGTRNKLFAHLGDTGHASMKS